jgi:hypothetical protein
VPKAVGSLPWWYTGEMTEMPDHLAIVRAAARRLAQAEKRREAAQEALQGAVRDAHRAGIRAGLLMKASGLPNTSYYRIVGPKREQEGTADA